MHVLLALLSAASILHGWDERREAAWAASDPAALRALYVPRSVAGEKDVRLLREYAARGLVVRRILTQVFALELLHLDGDHVRLRVVDRVAGGLVGTRPLGTTPPVSRVISMRRVDGEWRVVSVRQPAPRPARR